MSDDAGAAIVLLVLVGVACRLVHYVDRPSYWNDEAAIVVNVLHRSYGKLLRPLDYAQVAPPLFLWAERFLYHTLGPSEYVLRSLPLALGLAAVPMFALLAWRVLPPGGALWAVAWFALSDKIIPHVYEVKQYSGDIFVAVLLLLLATGGRHPAGKAEQTVSPARFWVLSLIAAVGLWFSYPAAFVYGGISLVLFPELFRRGTSGRFAWVAGNISVALSFCTLYHFALKPGHDPYLDLFWQKNLVDWSHPLYLPVWLWWRVYDLCNYIFASVGWLVLFVTFAGAIALWRTDRRRILLLFLGILSLNFLAACLGKYPFAGQRVSLFTLPLQFLVMGAGAQHAAVGVTGWAGRWWWVAVWPLLLLGVGQTAWHTVHPEDSSTIRPVALWLHDHRKPDEAIYLAADAKPDRPSYPTGRNVELRCYWLDPWQPVHETLPPPAQIRERKFWIVYSMAKPKDSPQMSLAPYGTPVTTFTTPQAGALLFIKPVAVSQP